MVDATGPRPGTPEAEVDIDVGLVNRLVASQCPEWGDLPVRLAATGWDNAMYRLGDDLAVRLPRRSIAAPLVEHEQRWLPLLAQSLPLRVPAPRHNGLPALGYPFAWSVVDWVEGATAAAVGVEASGGVVLAQFLRALHDQPAPVDAPRNPSRGCPLSVRNDSVLAFIARIYEGDHQLSITRGAYEARWVQALLAPMDLAPSWIHGDLHPKNVIVADGQPVVVIDWGDMCGGDPATDLAIAWMLFDDAGVASFQAAYGAASDATWSRAQGWAIFFGTFLLATGMAGDPEFSAVGRRALESVIGASG